MSVLCMAQVWKKSAHNGTDLLMLLALADFADDEGNSYPAVSTLASKCRMKTRNANYVIKALQESGELKVLKNEGPRGTNRYRIMLAQLGTSRPLQRVAPLQSTAPLQHSAPTPATQCAKPLQPIADKPSLNHQEPSVAKLSVPKGFDQFYMAYPKKVAKQSAIKAFKTAGASIHLEAILADLDLRKTSDDWVKDGGKYIPHPASYLNGKRWEDDAGARSGPMSNGGILPGAI